MYAINNYCILKFTSLETARQSLETTLETTAFTRPKYFCSDTDLELTKYVPFVVRKG